MTAGTPARPSSSLTAVANRCAASSCQLRGGSGDHSGALPLMRTCPAHAFAGHMTVAFRDTFTTLTPLAGILTFSRAAQITRRGRAPQQRVRSLAFEGRDPSIIIPNHPPHTAHASRAPSASAHSHCSFAACAGHGSTAGGRRTSSTAQGPLLSSWGRAPSRGRGWRGCRARYRRPLRDFRSPAPRSPVSGRLRGGWGVGTALARYVISFCIHNLECQSSFLE